ncbi:hypothetical protein [Ciceribacter sp. RN22]|uniref:hypothetical protein n=1 Tax=Ciceribacter sp. RN22 TaxID=2954932 RepID=UPI0020927E99|nr:hypothetical protein [Ciceribacter sp. RN22]MCO6176668.1 hypothetical protein [Ciceribacter sp. RN22]
MALRRQCDTFRAPKQRISFPLTAEPHIAANIPGMLLNETGMAQLARYGDFGGQEKFRRHYDKH